MGAKRRVIAVAQTAISPRYLHACGEAGRPYLLKLLKLLIVLKAKANTLYEPLYCKGTRRARVQPALDRFYFFCFSKMLLFQVAMNINQCKC